MALTIALLLASLALSLTVYFGGGYYPNLMWVWLPFVLILAFFLALFAVYALFLVLFAFAIRLRGEENYRPNRFGMWVLSETCFVLQILCRVRVHASGMGKVPSTKTKFMLVSNHLSGFDHIGLISLFVKHDIICISKKQNKKIPGVGGWLRYAGYLFIDQNDILSGTRLIEQAGTYISEGTCSVCIAPEGTRNKNFPNPEILPFHPGSFAMAYQSKCPIVVFAIQNTNCVLKRFPLKGTDVYFDCVGVLEYDEYKSLTQKELAEKVQGLIQKRFDHKRARFYHLPVKPENTETEKAE